VKIDLDLLKSHLIVEHCEDDDLIQNLFEAVKEQAEGYLDAKIVESISDSGDVEREVLYSKSIQTAIFIGVAHIYENRGDAGVTSVSRHDLPLGFHALLINKRLF